jgi:beta-lactamase regulating signal transducer with metallopeptidase domain
MTLLLLASAVGLLVLPGCARPLGRRLPPAEWAKVCAGLLLAGSVALEAGLVVVGGPTALRLAGMRAVADLCEHLLGALAPGGTPLGVAAALIALLVAVATGRALVRAHHSRRVLRVEPEIGWHRELLGHDLVVLPSEELVAFSASGRPPQVVVSQRLVDLLADDELAAVLRHELAHVRHRHDRYLLLARVVEQSLGLLPLVRRSTGALRCALERWADEEAAGGGRRGRESVRAALVRLLEAAAVPEAAAFMSLGTVVERLQALQAAPASGSSLLRRSVVYLPALVLVLLAVVALEGTVEHVAVLRVFAGLCPPH